MGIGHVIFALVLWCFRCLYLGDGLGVDAGCVLGSMLGSMLGRFFVCCWGLWWVGFGVVFGVMFGSSRVIWGSFGDHVRVFPASV